MLTRQDLDRLRMLALLTLIHGAGTELGARLIDLITWWLTNH